MFSPEYSHRLAIWIEGILRLICKELAIKRHRYHSPEMTEGRREPRIAVSIQGRYRSGSGLARDVVVTDLSTSGCKFYDRFSNLKNDDRVTIKVGNVGPIGAVVRWRTGQIIGVEFEAPLHASVLDHMVTTISDWSVSELNRPPTSEPVQPEQVPDPDEISIRIRPPTKVDFRMALSELELTLPLASVEDVEAVFHRVLNVIFVRSSDD
jgi:hypothetical protein